MSVGSDRSRVTGFLDEHWLLLTAVLASLAVANLVVQRTAHQWHPGFVRFELGFAVLTIALPLTIRFLRRALLQQIPAELRQLSADATERWLDEQVKPLGSSIRGPLACALLMLLPGVASTEVLGIPWTGWVRNLFWSWAIVYFTGYGLVAWLYTALVVVSVRMRRLKLECSVFSWPQAGIREIYSVYSRSLFVGAALYVGGVVSVWASPGGEQIALDTGIGRLWVFPPGAMVILFFLNSNYRIHLLLRQCKSRSDRELSELLEQALVKWKTAPSEDAAKHITALVQWRKEVRSEATWPLDFKSVLATVLTLLLPTAKAVVDLVAQGP